MVRLRHALYLLLCALGVGLAGASGYFLGGQHDIEEGMFLGLALVAVVAGIMQRAWWSVFVSPTAIFAGFWLGRVFACGDCPFWDFFWRGGVTWDEIAGPALVICGPGAIGAALGTLASKLAGLGLPRSSASL